MVVVVAAAAAAFAAPIPWGDSTKKCLVWVVYLLNLANSFSFSRCMQDFLRQTDSVLGGKLGDNIFLRHGSRSLDPPWCPVNSLWGVGDGVEQWHHTT